ncbi:MAG: serine hydrolase [bacterium]|nr:serine hydrolase [bacterium]MDZ4231545.1 serine hydrolase [Patescibacteria group bacterium]
MKKANNTVLFLMGLALVVVMGVALSVNNTRQIEAEPLAEVSDAPELDNTSLVADAQLAKGSTSQTNIDDAEIVEDQPAVAAGAYLMSGKQLTGWKVDKRWPIASITKLLSAYVAETLMDPDQSVVISQRAVDTVGTTGDFKLGELFSVRDLVKAMLIVSSNDAAAALSQNYGEEQFVAEMNAVASRVGMVNSRFVEPTGLSVQNQSTVEDLLKLVRYVWESDEEFFRITRQSTDIIVDTNTGVARQLININRFSARSDFLGGKTGTLPEADSNLISVFSVGGFSEPVVIVVLGSKDRFGETQKILLEL